VKVGGKQSKRFAEISDYVGKRREVKDSKSIPIGSPVAQNKPPVPIGSQTQPSEAIGHKQYNAFFHKIWVFH
jgi:hypothetical protein